LARVLTFDSGIGGLGVVAELRKALPPGTGIDYLADTALFPYGEQPDGVIKDRCTTLLRDAEARFKPDLIVIACNTASTIALDTVRQAVTVPVVGTVPPIRWAARETRSHVIGLLATRATITRPYVHALQRDYAPNCILLAHGARGLADMAEHIFRYRSLDQAELDQELDYLFSQKQGNQIDTIALGCTHYTFLLPALRQHYPDIIWLDPAPAVARQAQVMLTRSKIKSETGRQDFFTETSDSKQYSMFKKEISNFGFSNIK